MDGLDPLQDNHFFEQALFQVTGLSLTVNNMHFTSGGCINNAVQLSTQEGDFFIKWNENPGLSDMFTKEAEGLELLRGVEAIYIPKLIGTGQVAERRFLVLEFIQSRHREPNYWEQLGQGLAHLHAQTSPTFGLDHDNFIGRLVQKNDPKEEWLSFFIENRLRVQAGLALYNGLVDQAFLDRMARLYDRLPDLLVRDKPALLHGDLWSGNVMVNQEGRPCIMDPAVYYGHREIELAFTRLFGGFDDRFYMAYQEAFPLEPGFDDRATLYNLYPLLVHLNLFGTSYLSGVERVLKQFGC